MASFFLSLIWQRAAIYLGPDLSAGFDVLNAALPISTRQDNASIAMRPLQIKNAVNKSAVLRHYQRLSNAPPQATRPCPHPACCCWCCCWCSDGTIVVSLNSRFRSRVDDDEVSPLQKHE